MDDVGADAVAGAVAGEGMGAGAVGIIHTRRRDGRPSGPTEYAQQH